MNIIKIFYWTYSNIKKKHFFAHLQIITSGGVTYKNEPWHRECFTCTNCSTSLAGQRFTSRDEKPYCAECFGELFAKRCTACTKPITGTLLKSIGILFLKGGTQTFVFKLN